MHLIHAVEEVKLRFLCEREEGRRVYKHSISGEEEENLHGDCWGKTETKNLCSKLEGRKVKRKELYYLITGTYS